MFYLTHIAEVFLFHHVVVQKIINNIVQILLKLFVSKFWKSGACIYIYYTSQFELD
jgi:hypothetical protein